MNKLRKIYVTIVLVACGFIVGCSANKSEKFDNPPENNNTSSTEKQKARAIDVKIDHKNTLENLEQTRITTIKKLCKINLEKKENEEAVAKLEHEIEHRFKKQLSQTISNRPS